MNLAIVTGICFNIDDRWFKFLRYKESLLGFLNGWYVPCVN